MSVSLISPAGPLILPHSYYSLSFLSHSSFSAFKATRSLFICKCQRDARAIVTSCSFSSTLLHITSLSLPSQRVTPTGCQARIIRQVRTNEWVWNIFSYFIKMNLLIPCLSSPLSYSVCCLKFFEGSAAAAQTDSDSN